MTRRQRLKALEQSLGAKKHRTALVLLVATEPTPEQQAALEEAERVRRPILIIRGTPPEIDSALSVIVDVDHFGGSGSHQPDMTPLPRSGRWA